MEAALRKIDATLKAKGFRFARPPAIYRGPVMVHGNEATVEIEIGDVTFARLPIVRLIDRAKLPVKDLAHLVGDREVCYHGGSLVLDLYDPGGSVLRVLADTATALADSFAGGASAEFERELASYWQGNVVYFSIPRTASPAIVRGEAVPHSGAAEAGYVVVPEGTRPTLPKADRKPATIISLPRNLTHTARFPLPNLAAVLDYLGTQTGLPAGWRPAVISAAARGEQMFLSAPNAILGWRPEFPASIKVLLKAAGVRPEFIRRAIEKAPEQIGLDRLMGREVDLTFCVNRNLAGDPSLVGKRVALVGCGTIGGYLARMLVQTGAGCGAPFTLYDTDKLSPGNLGRHLLGFPDLGKRKAEALADHLRAFHPDVEVMPRIVDATTDWPALEKADIIIDATGEPNVATALNELFLRSSRTGDELALLHSFVFGNGVAGQSFLNIKDGHACYRCLKTAFDGQWRYSPLKDRSSPLREAPATCGEGGYVPFAVDAPSAAAGLALRATLDWASGHPGARLRTVIVDHAAGCDKPPWVSPKPLAGCDACGGT